MIKFCLKAASTSRPWVVILYAVGASLISLLMYPLVIEQPLTIISELLASEKFVVDIAVITSVESIAGIFMSVLLLDNYFMEKAKRKKYLKILKVIPGVVFIFGIAYFQLQFFKLRIGANFLSTAILYSAIIFTITLITAFLIREAVKSESLRLELKVLLNIAILIIGLLVSSSVADYNSSDAETVVEWKALGTMVLLGSFTILIGYIFPKIKPKNKIFKTN